MTVKPSDNSANATRPRIVDLVFAGEPASPLRRLAIVAALVIGLYAGLVLSVVGLGRSAAEWSIQMAARVHDLISAERSVDLSPPPRAPPPAPPTVAYEPLAAVPDVRARSAPKQAAPAPALPAQAGKVAAAITDPVDFTGMAFVVGTGSSYAGGTTTTSATSRRPPIGTVAPGRTGDGKGNGATDVGRPPSLARAVSLDQSAWTCAWPNEADAQLIDEQTVVIRAHVRPEGTVDAVEVVSDPGFGFGQAARLCAERTRFEPARDARGQVVGALSPPIRVHFFR